MIVEGVISVWSSVPPPPIITSAPPPAPPPLPQLHHPIITGPSFSRGSSRIFTPVQQMGIPQNSHHICWTTALYWLKISQYALTLSKHKKHLVINLLSPLPLPALIQSWVNTTRDFQSSLWRWWQRWVKVVTWYHSHYHHGDEEKKDSDNNDDDD